MAGLLCCLIESPDIVVGADWSSCLTDDSCLGELTAVGIIVVNSELWA